MALPRLKRRSEFLRVAGSGIKAATPGLVLQVLPRTRLDDGDPDIRVGFTASRRVGGAVERNRVKRRLRAVAERVLPQGAVTECDYVLIGRTGTLTRPYEKLVRDLEGALRRTGHLKTGGETPTVERRTN